MIGYRWEAERSDEVMRARQEMRDEREMKTNNTIPLFIIHTITQTCWMIMAENILLYKHLNLRFSSNISKRQSNQQQFKQTSAKDNQQQRQRQ